MVKGGISYIPWCIASYYIIKLQNARDPISSPRTWQLNNDGSTHPGVEATLYTFAVSQSIYYFSFTIPNISLVESKKSVLAVNYELTSLMIGSPRKCS